MPWSSPPCLPWPLYPAEEERQCSAARCSCTPRPPRPPRPPDPPLPEAPPRLAPVPSSSKISGGGTISDWCEAAARKVPSIEPPSDTTTRRLTWTCAAAASTAARHDARFASSLSVGMMTANVGIHFAITPCTSDGDGVKCSKSHCRAESPVLSRHKCLQTKMHFRRVFKMAVNLISSVTLFLP